MLGFLLLPIVVVLVGINEMVKMNRRAQRSVNRQRPQKKLNTKKNVEIIYLEDKKATKNAKKEAYKEVYKRCKELTSNREMPYLSVEEINDIIKELEALDKNALFH